MEEKAKSAVELYNQGCNCAQSVFCAFANDLGLDEKTAYKLIEGFGGGFGGRQEVCGAFSAATAVIGYHLSSGSMDGKSKANTYKAIRRAAEIFEQKYGSIRCKEILHGNAPKPFGCSDKVREAVLTVYEVLSEQENKDA